MHGPMAHACALELLCREYKLTLHGKKADLFNINIIVPLSRLFSTIYNMSGRVVSDIQTRAENDSSYEFIGEVILKINVV